MCGNNCFWSWKSESELERIQVHNRETFTAHILPVHAASRFIHKLSKSIAVFSKMVIPTHLFRLSKTGARWSEEEFGFRAWSGAQRSGGPIRSSDERVSKFSSDVSTLVTGSFYSIWASLLTLMLNRCSGYISTSSLSLV